MNKHSYYIFLLLTVFYYSCKVPQTSVREANTNLPSTFGYGADSINSAQVDWEQYFNDPYLSALIDTALVHNQELNILQQEIAVLDNEVLSRSGEYLPFVSGQGGLDAEKVGRYTSLGASEATTDIYPGHEMPDPVPNIGMRARMSWEIDIWHKLHDAKDAAFHRYLSSIEGRNFMVTNLVAEIASSYYELLAIDNQLKIVNQNLHILNDALETVKQLKIASRVTELAVKKFEAEVFQSQSRKYKLHQQITETENRINFLVGRYPQKVERDTVGLSSIPIAAAHAGVPSQLLRHRPDIRAAEQEIQASKLDVRVARANFYPSLEITADLGLAAFSPKYLLRAPESMLYSLAGDMIGPLVNKKAIQAEYNTANKRQLQAVYEYEMRILQAHIEVANQLARYRNTQGAYELLSQEVDALNKSIEIAGFLFKNARADYMEVLMTQRDALDSRLELVEARRDQLLTMVSLYQALGGGWKFVF